MNQNQNCHRCNLISWPLYRGQDNQSYCGRCLTTQTTTADLTMQECQINVSFPLEAGWEREFLTSKTLLQELARRIGTGEITFLADQFNHQIGLAYQDYQFKFPARWEQTT